MTKLTDFLNSAIKDVAPMARQPKTGDLFGIELECEGRNVDYDGTEEILLDWAPHQDGSLRNNHGSSCEWVFNGPVKYKKSVERVNSLFEYFEKRKTKLVMSNRTSTHVHFNMGDKSVYQLVNLYIVFTILEDLLDTYCGPDRKGNLFCLSSRHAEEQLRWIEDFCFRKHRIGINDNNRYCSLNLASIHKFGTVEFRGMRGLDNKEDILSWLDILNQLCDFACYKMKNPVTLVEDISVKTPVGFLKEIFSDDSFNRLTEGLTENYVSDSIYEGLRLVQMLCYRIGTEFDEIKLKGRDFWGSFSDDVDVPVERDVDPANFARPRGNPARPLNAPQAPRPRNPAIQALIDRERARLRAAVPGGDPIHPRFAEEVRAAPRWADAPPADPFPENF